MTPAATRLQARSKVRRLEPGDLDAVLALHRQVFGGSLPEDARRPLLARLFFEHPWQDDRLGSLVCEGEDGAILGCIGVMPRPMTFEGAPILAAVLHDFMVAPERRSTLAAFELLKAVGAGPQDLSVAEGNEASRRLCSAFGWVTCLPASLRWTHALRPASYALSLMRRRGMSRVAGRALAPAFALADAVVARLPRSPFRHGRSPLQARPLDAKALWCTIDRASRGSRLAPRHDVASLAWLLEGLERGPGVLRRALFTSQSDIVGWYLYQVERGGIAEVVQLGANEGSAGAVIEHLLHDARQQGAVAVSGQLDPELLPVLSEKLCVLHRGRGGSWILAHARDRRILQALQLGEAFFTRLEGEWWIARSQRPS